LLSACIPTLSFFTFIDLARRCSLQATMVSRKLMGIWAFLDFSLLVAGATTLALSIVWRAPNVLKNMVYSDADLTGWLS
jgi:hypothetical protein